MSSNNFDTDEHTITKTTDDILIKENDKTIALVKDYIPSPNIELGHS